MHAPLPRKPRTLKSDSRIGVIAPAGWSAPEDLERAIHHAQTHYGLNIFLHPQCYLRDGNSAGSTADKIKAFHDVWQDPSVDAVWAARGGSRALHLLHGLDWDILRAHQKILIGYSDVTCLLNSFYRETGLVSFHGPLLGAFSPDSKCTTQDRTLSLLKGDWEQALFPVTHDYHVLRAGEVTAPLIGGNLSLIYALAASQHDTPLWQDHVLLIEDIDEDIRHIDRIFGALRLAGVFKQIKGLMCGPFTGMTDTSTYPFGRNLQDLIVEHILPDINGPVIMNAPFGHIHANHPFPVGVPTHIKATQAHVTVKLAESPFSD
jgi:muramoyltetrapeptide carboxypeptidase